MELSPIDGSIVSAIILFGMAYVLVYIITGLFTLIGCYRLATKGHRALAFAVLSYMVLSTILIMLYRG